MAKYGFGIVGAGMIAHFQGRAVRDLKNAKLIGFCDQIEAAAKRAGEEFGVHWTTNYPEFLARDDIDIISICTPSGTHRDCAVPAAKAGKHVIVEKPLEITLGKCDAIINACRAAGVKLCGIFPSRFSDSSQTVKKALEKGRFGRLTLGDAYVKWWRSQEYYDKGGWKGTRAMDGGGALMNQSIHAVDLLQWFMGPVESVTAATGTLVHERIEVEDTAVATLKFRNGALGVIEGATSVFPGFMKKIEISGDQGSVVLEEEDIKVWQFAKERPEDQKIREELGSKTMTGGGAADPKAIGHEGHRRQFADFLKALDKGTEPLVNGEEARKAVEIILGIYKAAETGRPVKLPL
jgi:predicted dehydrogenase